MILLARWNVYGSSRLDYFLISDKERERILEKQRKDSLKYSKVEIQGDETRSDEIQAEFDAETVVDNRRTTSQSSTTTPSVVTVQSLIVEPQPRVAHALSHDLAHGEPVSVLIIHLLVTVKCYLQN